LYLKYNMGPSCKILPDSLASIEACAKLLADKQLVAVPTETVYGLAGNALCEKVVRKIFDVKGRPLIDPLISHFKNAKDAFSHVEANSQAVKLAAEFWPGPLTMVLHKKASIPDLVTAGLSTAAVRVPAHPTLLSLLQKLDFPVAAPSANPFGYISPTRPEHVETTLGSKIAAILDGGPCDHGLESTVIDISTAEKPKLLRPGPISSEQIEGCLKQQLDQTKISQNDSAAQLSPGLLTKHYSPNTKIRIIEHGSKDTPTEPNEALILNRKPEKSWSAHVYWLSVDGKVHEIARNFFDLLQKLDKKNYHTLIIEAVPNEGIGIALNDRLQRAAAD